jgi:hypothetical protein
MSDFAINAVWRPHKGETKFDATIASLRIEVRDKNVAAYRSDQIGNDDHLFIPVYNLAEWIAENWWPILWEPRKSEDYSDDPDFGLRHSFVAAGGGFPLPDVSLTSQGDLVLVRAKSRRTQIEDLYFYQAAEKPLPRKEVERVLRGFVQKTVERLAAKGIENTILQEQWSLILEHSAEAELFAKCMGALGLSPYSEEPQIESILDRAHEALGDQLTFDLCLASTPQNLENMVKLAVNAKEVSASDQSKVDLAALRTFQLPPQTAAPAWHRGKNAATKLREHLGIKADDPCGSTKVMEAVGLALPDTLANEDDTNELRITGLMHREDDRTAHLALLQRTTQKRRFAAARGIFAACDSKANDCRLITMAVTRDQQANRAFAAELTAPIAFIRSFIRRGKLDPELIPEIADQLNIASDVVLKHAMNNGTSFAERKRAGL